MKKLTKVILVSSLAQEGRGNRWRSTDRSLRSFLNFRKVLKLKEREVDFVVKGSSDLLCYIQVAVTVAEKEKYSQEVAAFKSIRDNYPKLILTLDDIFIENRNGIQTMNVIDFITGRCNLPV